MIARVYAAINAVTAAFARHGVPKEQINLADDYAYRSIDDVVIRLAPLLAEHKLCVLPRVLEREMSERTGASGEPLLHVTLKAAYDLVSLEDGSRHTVKVFGEALDASDKATAKALQSAYKYAVIQAFAIPVSGSEDADARSSRLAQNASIPAEGWQRWCEDVTEMIRSSDSGEALDRLQRAHRATLGALQREQAGLYTSLGVVIAARRAELAGKTGTLGYVSPSALTVTPDDTFDDPVRPGGEARSRPTRKRPPRQACEKVLRDA